ncbi:Fha domain-containing protein ps1 [Thalictrum thalictroides]|uniref:Fha domain-containing protein ps1 n=1 Tax=Thalictrum thalictroides TaxID=46969 RepID=A0A7J6VYZ6_THATH|nr:Fha domain-containing protein ps1 [Thalictrum thalictroides]
MAEKKEETEEKKIPVFTVFKKGMIFKNIFLLDKNTPSPLSFDSQSIKSTERNNPKDDIFDDDEEMLLVGRHPDCNIMLEHPSISRFHLQMRLQPSLQKLTVMDLSSAHGTWVSDRKIEPQVSVELSEGDSLRLGASTRSYRLHWIPLSRLFDVENPLVSPNFENPLPSDETEEEKMSKNENLILLEQKYNPSAPPMPEFVKFTLTDDVEVMSPYSIHHEEEKYSPIGVIDHSVLSRSSGPLGSESVTSSPLLVERISSERMKQQFDKENQENAPTTIAEAVPLVEENQENEPFRLEHESNTPSLWLRRGKPASSIRIQTARSKGKNKEAGRGVGTDSENCNARSLIPQVLFAGSDRGEDIVTPGKENYTPKTAHRSQSGKKGMIEELADQKFYNSSSPNRDENKCMSTFSEKENLTPIVLHGSRLKKPLFGSQLRHEEEMIMNKRRLGRVPFGSLVIDSNMSNKSEVSVSKTTARGSSFCDKTNDATVSTYANQSYGEASRRWYMVVDTNCLLNKDSRRSLKLLQGLRGTQLIIPRLVIRELVFLKRRGSLFGRATEVTSVLQWIEQCMVETKWWIHVQKTMEESRSIAPTPPASPHLSSWLSEASSGVFGRSPWGSSEEIVSPTAEDHILDCALLFKRIKKDHGQLVLLSDDISLKIKAMAEGLLCETTEEFRGSLVNPYSTRFLWVQSTPRGPTWSSLEEAEDLRENYYCVPLKKTASRAAEGAKKGLKLILLHNYSHYGQIGSVN